MERTSDFDLEPGLHHVDPHNNLSALFALDCQIATGGSMVAFETPDELTEFLADSSTYVLNEAERSVGLLAVSSVSDTTLEVLSVGIIPEAQGKGYGRIMMDHAEQLAKQAGKSVVELVTKVSNSNAITFYEHLGYTKKEVVKGHYSQYNDTEDRVRLEKHL